MDSIETLQEWIRECPQGGMVFFGGAGVSTESGIPDFRSSDGMFNQRFAYPPEQMVSHSFFETHPQEFYDFYFERMIAPQAQPNQAHRKLAELESAGILRAVITQNVDGLHQAAGSRNVLELHGSVHRNYCLTCGERYDLAAMMTLHSESPDGVPRCTKCGATVRPDVVLYEEPLNDAVMIGAVQAISQASLLVVAGTSLAVYPAAGLLAYFQGEHLAVVNLSPTPMDKKAHLCVQAKVGEVFTF